MALAVQGEPIDLSEVFLPWSQPKHEDSRCFPYMEAVSLAALEFHVAALRVGCESGK